MNHTYSTRSDGSFLAFGGGPLNELHHRHPTWYYWFLGYTALAFVCLIAGHIDERTFQGVSLWHKPFKFALSLAIFFATLGWFAALMQPGYFETRRGKLLTQIPSLCALFEMAYIFIQAARGEASHYNESSSFYAGMYFLMGLGATLMVGACLWMGSSILRNHPSKDVWVLSVAIGLIGTFVLGGGFGAYLGNNAGGHWVGGTASDAGSVPLVHWSRTGGDLRVAHFFGIHAMQIIPLCGAFLLWLSNRKNLSSGAAKVALASFTIAFAAFCTSTFVQAVRGLPLL